MLAVITIHAAATPVAELVIYSTGAGTVSMRADTVFPVPDTVFRRASTSVRYSSRAGAGGVVFIKREGGRLDVPSTRWARSDVCSTLRSALPRAIRRWQTKAVDGPLPARSGLAGGGR